MDPIHGTAGAQSSLLGPGTFRNHTTTLFRTLVIACVTFAAGGVAGRSDEADVAPNDPGEPRGPTLAGVERAIRIDTSLVLLPLAKRLQTRIGERRAGVEFAVDTTGTETALTRLCLGETTLAAIARAPTTADRRLCERNRFDLATVRLAHQAVAVVANRTLGMECVRTGALARLWRAGSGVSTYRDAGGGLPQRPVSLHAPALELEEPDFFSKAVVGREGDLRRDVDFAKDSRALDAGLARDENGLGFRGLEPGPVRNTTVTRLAVDDGRGCVRPSWRAIQAGRYRPLARPLFLAFTLSALDRRPTAALVRHALRHSSELADYPGVVPLSDTDTRRQIARLAALEAVAE